VSVYVATTILKKLKLFTKPMEHDQSFSTCYNVVTTDP